MSAPKNIPSWVARYYASEGVPEALDGAYRDPSDDSDRYMSLSTLASKWFQGDTRWALSAIESVWLLHELVRDLLGCQSQAKSCHNEVSSKRYELALNHIGGSFGGSGALIFKSKAFDGNWPNMQLFPIQTGDRTLAASKLYVCDPKNHPRIIQWLCQKGFHEIPKTNGVCA